MSDTLQMTILIPALNEQGNIGELIRRCRAVLDQTGISGEMLVVDGGSSDKTVSEAEEAGARVIAQKGRGYAGALKQGFAQASGERVLTMDSDLSHEPEVIAQLWAARDRADVLIASRYVPGGKADMTAFRAVLSRILNFVFTRALSIPVKDISSGFRLYRRVWLEKIEITTVDFDVLEEILIKIYNLGGTVAEVPFHYRPRKEGKSHAKLFKFGVAYCKTLVAMWKLRRSGGGSK